jgi:hypothetical protein
MDDSFVSDVLSPEQSEQVKHFLSTWLLAPIYQLAPLMTRRLTVQIVDQTQVTVMVGTAESGPHTVSTTDLFYPYLVQTAGAMYLVVVSRFLLYDYLTREPSREEQGERGLEAGIRRVLGLQLASAYQPDLLEGTAPALAENNDLRYSSDDQLAYLSYRL